MKYFSSKIRIILITLLLTGIVAFFYIDASATLSEPTAKKKDWEIATRVNLKASKSDHKRLQNLNIWKSKPTTTLAASSSIDWSLKGIVFESKIPYALIYKKDDNVLSKYKVNDVLPNGEKLTQITNNSITFESEGETTNTKLHQY